MISCDFHYINVELINLPSISIYLKSSNYCHTLLDVVPIKVRTQKKKEENKNENEK